MSYQVQINSFSALDEWFVTPLGRNVAKAFVTELSHLSLLLHGDILLQLGSGGENLWLENLLFQHKWLATPQWNSQVTTFACKLNQLSLDRNSVDCVVAPLTMEAFPAFQKPLDEIDRVLKPMGHIVFLGINPISLWGVWLKYARNHCYGFAHGYPKSVFSLKRALLHRGYIQCHLNSFFYIPPFKNERLLARLEILNEIGKMVSLMPAGFYCLVVQKFVEQHPDFLLHGKQEIMPEPASALFKPMCREKRHDDSL
ncbi:class I SAM-dependent methyltransferase [Legionella spiritensis]|uniref:class I SAM-dependent methyltransferase n=1 Tax=Legionella spiritensis TaxID=452 RepID=UPI0015585DF6|nr:methyltransferase domain-containing protein [Legionella spiritensis]